MCAITSWKRQTKLTQRSEDQDIHVPRRKTGNQDQDIHVHGKEPEIQVKDLGCPDNRFDDTVSGYVDVLVLRTL